MGVDAYIELPEETEESMDHIIRSVESVISGPGLNGLKYESDYTLNEDGTRRVRIEIYNLPDTQSILYFSDRVGEGLRMPILFRPLSSISQV
jgi:hypothetical protein